MKPEVVALVLTLVGQVVTGTILIWRVGRRDGMASEAMAGLTRTVEGQARSIETLSGALALESRLNAVQDARLAANEKRLDDHDDDINELRRRP